MLYDASLAILFNGTIPFNSDLTVLNVQLLETPAEKRDILHPYVRDEIAAPQTQLLQVRAALRQGMETSIANITLSKI